MTARDWMPSFDTPTARKLFPGGNQGSLGAMAMILFSIVVIAGGIFVGIGAYKGTERDVVTIVESKERVCGRANDDCKYLLFTQARTFQITDTFLYGRFNTSDVYGRIEPKQRYKLHVVGWRVGYLSWYPNVLTAQSAEVGK